MKSNRKGEKMLGEFLVRKELISEEQLLLCLVKQQENLESVQEILLKEDILSAEQKINFLEKLTDFGISCKKVLEEMGLGYDIWNQVKVQSIESQIPLGQLLIMENILTIDAVQAALTEYERQQPSQTLFKKSHFAQPPINPALIKEYFSAFGDKFFEKMSTSMIKLNLGCQENQGLTIEEAKRIQADLNCQYNEILGGSRFISADLTRLVTQELLILLSSFLVNSFSDVIENWSSVVEVQREYQDFLFNINDSLRLASTECPSWDSERMQKKIRNLCKKIEKIALTMG